MPAAPSVRKAWADGQSSLSAPTPGTGIVRNPLLSDRDVCLHVHPRALSSPGAERSGSLPASRRLVGTGGHQCPLGASGSPWRPVPATAPMLSLLSVLPGMKVGSYTADLIQPPPQALSPHPGMVRAPVPGLRLPSAGHSLTCMGEELLSSPAHAFVSCGLIAIFTGLLARAAWLTPSLTGADTRPHGLGKGIWPYLMCLLHFI